MAMALTCPYCVIEPCSTEYQRRVYRLYSTCLSISHVGDKPSCAKCQGLGLPLARPVAVSVDAACKCDTRPLRGVGFRRRRSPSLRTHVRAEPLYLYGSLDEVPELSAVSVLTLDAGNIDDDILNELRQELGVLVEAATASQATHGFYTNRRSATVPRVHSGNVN